MPLLHSAFYRFVPLAQPVAAADTVRRLAQGLQGSVVLAAEGISGAVAGAPEVIAAFEHALQQPDVLDGALRGMAFKHSACASPPFGRLKVSVKPELVALGWQGALGVPGPAPSASMTRATPGVAAGAPDEPPHLPIDEHDASHLSPQAWRAMLALGDAVVLDNRNHFEFRLGHFRGAVDPQVHNFRDFEAWVQAQVPAWRAAGRPVAMYCTGGIRCEKTAPWLRSLGLQVWQLQGGVLNYFQHINNVESERLGHVPDDPHDDPQGGLRDAWQGECFVFDKRIALDTHLQETATTALQVYDPAHPDEAWRLERARRLDGADGA